jgi:hypothetical protein
MAQIYSIYGACSHNVRIFDASGSNFCFECAILKLGHCEDFESSALLDHIRVEFIMFNLIIKN